MKQFYSSIRNKEYVKNYLERHSPSSPYSKKQETSDPIKGVKKLLFSLLLVMGLMFSNFSFAQNAAKATTGTGLYKNKIFWINWDLNGNNSDGDIITNGTTRSFTSPAGVIYTATISNVVETIKGNFSSAFLDGYSFNNIIYGYNGFATTGEKIIALNNQHNGTGTGNKVSFRVSVTAQLPTGGIINPAGIAIAGSESLAYNGEYYQLSVPSTSLPLRYLDKYIYNNIWTSMSTELIVSNSGHTVKTTNPGSGDGLGDSLVLAEDVPYVDVVVQGGGGQSVAVGVFEELDYSDAPASYGAAFHIVNSSFSGGIFPDGNNFLSTTTNVLDANRATLVNPLLVIGSIVDTEPAAFFAAPGTIPNGDDTDGLADEDGIVAYQWSNCSGTVFVKNLTGTPAKLYVWIDANRNGTYDATELATVNVPTGTNGNVTIPLTSIAGLTKGVNYYSRLRLTTDLSLAGPTGFAPDGEVEDSWIQINQNVIASSNSPVCAGNTILLSATPVVGATYAWIGPNGFNSTLQNPTITNAKSVNGGTYTLTTTYSAGCSITDTTSIVVNSNPTVPITTVTQPTCTVPSGTITVTVQTASDTYSFDNGATFQALNVKSGLATGSYNVIIQNLAGCVSTATVTVINAQPATPVQPTLSTVTQPTCSTATGSFTITNYNAAYTYTFTPSAGVVNTAGTVTAPAGSYTVTATLVACTSVASASITINAQPATPAAPILSASTVTNPCPVTTANLLAAHSETTPTNTTLVWYTTPNPSSSSIAYATPTTATAGAYYAFYLDNVNGCLSPASASLTVTITACCAAGYISPILH